MKHRTQILLEDWQYQSLMEEASRLKVSFSSLIRKGIDRILPKDRPSKKHHKALRDFAGIIKNEKEHLTNKMIDRIIYKKDWQ